MTNKEGTSHGCQSFVLEQRRGTKNVRGWSGVDGGGRGEWGAVQ